ncbi:MAG TPA: glycerol-3-phosphate dehydrogenase/oxidase [Gemmatimonadaceae bacterium]|nr:glycerol-3-phosphate dehydrogenase/oxidase [Gemmatimonadaceae bacterium]
MQFSRPLVRSLSVLTEREYDVVVVGGGIYGICAAWDAVRRGLSVALVERGDFANATSANSFKMVHGGIRYLQHADVVRIRESVRDRNALLRVAPHLVHPLPIVIPTYGHGMRGRAPLRAGFLVYDLLAADRNRGIRDPDRRIPAGRLLSRDECLELFPHLDQRGLTGGGLFHDAQMYNPPRLALAFLRSAVDAGVDAANYVEAVHFIRRDHRVTGIAARDVLTGETFGIRARSVVNAAGPWAEHLLASDPTLRLSPPSTFSRDACFVVARPLLGKYALAVPGATGDPDAIISRNARHLFLVPWRGHTLVGVWHVVYSGAPDNVRVCREDLESFLAEINEAYPPLALTMRDISTNNCGLVLFGENTPGATNLKYGHRSRLVDHAHADGVDGLVTVIGVRWTTARGVATTAIDMVCRKLGRRTSPSHTESAPVHGGDIDGFESFAETAVRQRPPGVSEATMRSLAHNHGSAYQRVLRYACENPEWLKPVGTSDVIKAEVVHAVREEMAQHLTDVVFRRTDLGTGGHPGDEALRACADVMAAESGWSEDRTACELEAVERAFPRW